MTNMLCESSKTENCYRSGPVKFDEKSKIDNSIRNILNPSRVTLTMLMKSDA